MTHCIDHISDMARKSQQRVDQIRNHNAGQYPNAKNHTVIASLTQSWQQQRKQPRKLSGNHPLSFKSLSFPWKLLTDLHGGTS